MLPPTRTGEGGRGSSGGGGGGVGAGLLQPEALGVAERKRRLTAPEPPTRRPGYAGGDGSGSGASFLPLPVASGSSAATAIDLTAPPAARPYRGGGRAERADAGRRESDIVLPAWQPDSEVAQCPVCGNQFSFWYRKHHCRYVLGGCFFVFEGFGMGLRMMRSGFSAFLLLLGRLISQGGCVLRGTSLGVVLRGSALICYSLISLLSLLVALYFLRDHDTNRLPLENAGEWFVRIARHTGSRFPANSLSTLHLN